MAAVDPKQKARDLILSQVKANGYASIRVSYAILFIGYGPAITAFCRTNGLKWEMAGDEIVFKVKHKGVK